MKLEFLGHDERYIVEQSLMTLFPLEKPTYDAVQPGDEAWCRLAAEETAADCQVTAELHYHGYTAAGTFASPLTGTDFKKEGQRRYAVAACFYLAFLDLYPKLPEALRAAEKLTLPPWGMLTGVRPVKLPTREMAAGATPEQARASLERDCYVSPERAELAVDCAQASLNAQRTLKEDEVSLYVGIPFCPTRCAYCSFVSADVGRTLKLLEPYLDALLEEIDALGRILERTGKGLRTFYMGGGTPTTLSAVQLDRLLTRCREVLPLEGCTEYTVEAGRPDTIDRAKLEVLKGHGVGRISINPQTLEDHVLRAIGRKHAAGDIRAANDLARSVGFDCINMDLIAGLPQDSCEGFRRSLEGVLEMEPENVTIHTLALKKGSTLMERGGSLPSGAEVAEMLDFSREILIRRGYRPYYLYRQKYMSGALENVGWAKPGTENLYNIIMMEELQTVVSVGGGGVTKLVDYAAGRIVRLPNPKYPHDYLTSLKKVLAQKEELIRFYGSELP